MVVWVLTKMGIDKNFEDQNYKFLVLCVKPEGGVSVWEGTGAQKTAGNRAYDLPRACIFWCIYYMFTNSRGFQFHSLTVKISDPGICACMRTRSLGYLWSVLKTYKKCKIAYI